ncbi:MAG: DUF1566 domain-containing protein [Methylococcaceae bacterium]
MNKPKLLATIALLLLSSPTFAADKPEFIDNNDGTITHTPSGLVWQKCSVGQTWQAVGTDFENTPNFCSGDASKQNYGTASKITSDFAGQSDWRVPNIRELRSLVDFDKANPAINKTLFPKTPINAWFWSTSINASYPYGAAWVVNFDSGQDGYYSENGYNYAVRLVRGGQSFSFFSLATPTTDFLNNKDGTVTHNKTGLTWQRCAVGQTWIVEESACQGSVTTFVHADAKKLTSDLAGKTDWRLPTAKELETIADYMKSSPAINTTVFPNTPSMRFWTGSYPASVTDKSQAWVLDFATSWHWNTAATESYGVRLVRGASVANSTIATGGVDLALTITGTPNPATVNGNITFTATLTNKGTATATDAKLSFGLPKNTVSLVTKPDECTFTGLSVVCAVGNLVPNSSITKTVTVKMTKAGGLSFGVTSWANEKDVNLKNNIARATVAIKK